MTVGVSVRVVCWLQHRERLLQDHRVRDFTDKVQATSAELLEEHKDVDGYVLDGGVAYCFHSRPPLTQTPPGVYPQEFARGGRYNEGCGSVQEFLRAPHRDP